MILLASPLALLSMTSASSSQAADPDQAELTKIAAAASDPSAVSARPGNRRSESDDEIWLLAESITASGVSSDARGETIVAVFDLLAPDEVEEKVAKDFQLEIVDKVILTSLGWRVVRYRVPDLRPLDAVVESLRTDKRVRRAQVNVIHQIVEPSKPDVEVGSLKSPTPRPKGAQTVRKSAANAPNTHANAALREPHEQSSTSNVVRRYSTRSAKVTVGDVLSGGF